MLSENILLVGAMLLFAAVFAGKAAHLDQWVLAKLYQTEKKISENMDQYFINRYEPCKYCFHFSWQQYRNYCR